MRRSLPFLLAAAFPLLASAQADVRAVTTYESVGLYWSNPGADPATGCEVSYRRLGETAWHRAQALWYDAATLECRGSIVSLQAGTDYEAQLGLPGQAPARSVSFRTWTERKRVAHTFTIAGSPGTLDIRQGGTPDGYVLYQGAPGAVMDAANGSDFNITVNASYVIVRGLTLRGARQDAIHISPGVTDVIIEDNEITGWGRWRTGTWGVDMDSAIRADCAGGSLERVTIQRNRIHDPRWGANSWSDGHPQGPQAVTFSHCGGNHVIRHNEIWSSAGHYYNDILGGEDNFSTEGFPNRDSDIYGNRLSNAWDDGIEAEGGNRNVRVWGNYIDSTAVGIATALTTVGPFYGFRNVYNRSRELENAPLDGDLRQELFKAGSAPGFADGRRYFFHNTTLQAVDPSANNTLGVEFGISGSGADQPFNNAVSINNIFHTWKSDQVVYRQAGTGNLFQNDMYNGVANVPVVNGIHAAPTYAPGNGWQSESGGQYALAAGTPGYDAGLRLDNFNDGYLGAGPDVGAAEAGAPAMRFGIAASSGPAAPPTRKVRRDFDFSGTSDVVWQHADGTQVMWLMDGTNPTGGLQLVGAGTGWSVKLTADFDGNGTADLLWQHADGTVVMWLMSGTTVTSGAQLMGAGTGWTPQFAGDFDGDGRSDIVWRNADGRQHLWLMNGTTIAGGAGLVGAGSGWTVKQLVDLNADGKADILWQHTDGTVVAWLMNGATQVTSANLVGAGAWSPIQVGDLNGDGKGDILWRNTDGTVIAWLMDGTRQITSATLVTAGPWTVSHVGDFNGDGRSDLLWRNTSDGTVIEWIMNGTVPTQTPTLVGAGSGWSVRAIGNYDGNGTDDIVWEHADGTTVAWLMNGTSPSSGAQWVGAGTGWSVMP